MRANPMQAIAYMRGLAAKQAAGVKGMCLRTIQSAWAVPAVAPSAIAAWRMIPANERHTDRNTAGVGACHFWTGRKGGLAKYGHIAMQAEHEGFVWSTDVPVADRVGLVHIDYFEKNWGAIYLGWSTNLEGFRLPVSAVEAPK